MPTLNGSINDFVAGDDLEVDRTVTGLNSALTDAWLTIRAAARGSAVVTKHITEMADAENGELTNASPPDSADLAFFIGQSETAVLSRRLYFYDIQVKDSDGKIYTPESGRIYAKRQITTET